MAAFSSVRWPLRFLVAEMFFTPYPPLKALVGPRALRKRTRSSLGYATKLCFVGVSWQCNRGLPDYDVIWLALDLLSINYPLPCR